MLNGCTSLVAADRSVSRSKVQADYSCVSSTIVRSHAKVQWRHSRKRDGESPAG